MYVCEYLRGIGTLRCLIKPKFRLNKHILAFEMINSRPRNLGCLEPEKYSLKNEYQTA